MVLVCGLFGFVFERRRIQSKSDDKIQLSSLIIQKERSNVTCALGAYGTIHNVIIENNITSRFHLVLLLPKPHVVTP